MRSGASSPVSGAIRSARRVRRGRGRSATDYVELDPGKARAELLRQVRAWQLMLDTSVVGPVATIDGRRLHVQDASLDEPDDPDPLVSTRPTARCG